MDHFAGQDVSVKETSVCIVDETGKIVREVKVTSEPAALLAVLRNATYCVRRIGLEAGPLSQWLYSALQLLFPRLSQSSNALDPPSRRQRPLPDPIRRRCNRQQARRSGRLMAKVSPGD
jgi:hypothetical protein